MWTGFKLLPTEDFFFKFRLLFLHIGIQSLGYINQEKKCVSVKVLFIFRCSKIGKKSEGNHLVSNDCPHFFLPILLQRKMKSTLPTYPNQTLLHNLVKSDKV